VGPRIELIVALLSFASAAFLLFGCSERATDDDSPDGPFDSPYSGEELAGRIQEAIDKQGAYRITAQQEDLVLPRWGGTDGGTVTVGRKDGGVVAAAELYRTGDGSYDIWLRQGQTYFKRETCTAMARVPGGGGEVLDWFVFLGNDRIKNARELKAASGRTTLMLTLDGLGEAEISFLPGTFLPNQLSSREATRNGKPLVWTFGDWGKQPEFGVSATEFDKAYDRGPGGNPC